MSLGEFWFPLLLFLSASALALAGLWRGKLWRRYMLGAAGLLAVTAVLAFICGDPVRGPFTYLVRPHAKDKVTFHAGMRTEIPYKEISKGYDFSRFIRFNQPDSGKQPVELRIHKTWPFGWEVQVSVFAGPNNPALIFDNKEIKKIMLGADVNYDENAIELMMPPIGQSASFQLVFDGDDIYMNGVLGNAREANIMNGDMFYVGPIGGVKPSDLPRRIFKYPSYAHKGERQ